MLFTSYSFLLFIAVLIGLCIVCPGKHRWKILLVASLFFYAMTGLRYLIYIGTTIVSAYGAGILLDKTPEKSKRLRWLVLCLLLNLGILTALKYTNFAILNINVFIDILGGESLAFFKFALPLGISFYTFQTVGYVVDVYRGVVKAEKNPFKLALFTSFFPQVIQGPISRFGDLSQTLFSTHRISANEISFGLQRVVLGFFKKLVIADRLMIAIGILSSNPDEYNGIFVLLTALFFTVALYADFTGGIDITIGVAEALGVKITENFNRPFYAVSTAEYWRRWHITMGTWFRDYMYYPLLRSKLMKKFSKSASKIFGKQSGRHLPVYLTLIIVWFTTGLWHGASWNFIIWGLFNGLIIIFSEICSPLYAGFHNAFKIGQTSAYRAFKVARTFCLMSIITSIFTYESAGTYFRSLGTVFMDFGAGRLFSGELLKLGLTFADYIIVLASVFLLIIIGQLGKTADIRKILSNRPKLVRYLIVLVLVFSTIIFGVYGTGYDAAQFIYNQF